MTGAAEIVGAVLSGIAQALPGFLAAFSGKPDDTAAIAHARTLAARFAPVLPRLQARSAAARAAAARVTAEDVSRARAVASSPATGATGTASILALAALAEAHLSDGAEP